MKYEISVGRRLQAGLTAKPAGGVQMSSFVPMQMILRRSRSEIIAPNGIKQGCSPNLPVKAVKKIDRSITPLVRMLGLAHYWQQLMESGEITSTTEIADLEEMDLTYVRRVLRLTLLSPWQIESMLAGQDVAIDALMREAWTADWGR